MSICKRWVEGVNSSEPFADSRMKKSPISLAIAAAMGIGVADIGSNSVDAAIVPVELVSQTSASSGGSSVSNISNSTAIWSYDTLTGIVTATGLFSAGAQIAPVLPGQLFTHNIVNLAVGGGGAASATSYSCVEGSFGTSVFASLCGNYNYGADYTNESSSSWGPGTAFSKTMGGDDGSLGIQQNLSTYDGMTSSFNGTALTVSNVTFFPFISGNTMTFQVVPVPAAVWLFGSALGLLGWMRRKTA